MTTAITHDGVFETGCDLIDVTSMHRPDTNWRVVDSSGHTHQWFRDGQPATSYGAMARYDVPTLIWVKDGEEYWEDDDEPYDVGHNECRQCGEHIEPLFTADTTTQYIPGRRWHRINGEHVSPEEFKRRIADAGR